MSTRKTPVLLREGPLSGRIWALLRYRRTGEHIKGIDLTEGEREEIAAFRKALMEIVGRHNAGPHVRRGAAK